MERKTSLQMELGGKVRLLLFDFTFVDALVDRHDLAEVDEIARTRPWKLLPIIATAALTAGAELEGSTEQFDEKAVGRWISQHPDATSVHEIRVCYERNMAFFGLAVHGPRIQIPEESENGEASESPSPQE